MRAMVGEEMGGEVLSAHDTMGMLVCLSDLLCAYTRFIELLVDAPWRCHRCQPLYDDGLPTHSRQRSVDPPRQPNTSRGCFPSTRHVPKFPEVSTKEAKSYVPVKWRKETRKAEEKVSLLC